MILKYSGLLVLILTFINLSMGQTDTSIARLADLETVVVEATKIEKPWLETVTSNYTVDPNFKEQVAQNSLADYTLLSPSVFALNASNRAQDLRLSIRGFGARAAFGVRGVKLIVDGIPETTPDGQGQLDNLNLGIIDRIEVLNNGSAALYGNASGGVVNIQTTNDAAFSQKDAFAEVGLSWQSFNTQQHQLTAGKKWNNTFLIIHANHHQSDGYRDQSEFESTNFNIRFKQKFKAGQLEAIINYMDSPKANDPGGVNQTLYEEEPTAARDRNVLFNAGEAIDQFKTSLRYETSIAEKIDLNTYAFYSQRNFLGRLPFEFGGLIDLQRSFYGHGTTINGKVNLTNIQWDWQAAYEISSQNDYRQRFRNLEGVQGDQTLDQDEIFNNVGIYWLNQFGVQNWAFNASLRYDFNTIKANDFFLNNGDDSGEIELNDFNYSLGALYTLPNNNAIFANLSTSFETPTLNELSNNPDGSGFNIALKPQQATHIELGYKAWIAEKGRLQFSAFYIDSQDELLPFEIESNPGQTFFRNVGQTTRSGIELMLQYPIVSNLQVHTNWAINQFRFGDYTVDSENFDGNTLPGIPNFQGFLQFDWTIKDRLSILLQHQVFGEIFFTDDNTQSQKGQYIGNVSMQYDIPLSFGNLKPYLGIQNFTNTRYADNIRINAFGGRFYEAAPTAFVFSGIRLAL